MANGETIELTNSVALDTDVTLPENATITLLLGAYQITDSKSITIPSTTTLIVDALSSRFVAPEGYVVEWDGVDTEDGWRCTYTVVPTTWPVTVTSADGTTSKRYETAQDGFNASRDGDTVTLNEDVDVVINLKATDAQGVSSGNVTVDLNGHTGTKGASSAGGTVMTLKNGNVTNGTSSASKAVTAYGGSGKVIIESGNYTAGIAVHSAPGYNDTTAELVINGGTFVGTGNGAIKVDKASGSSRTNGGKITINGGDFTGAIVVDPAGTLVITGGTFSVDPSAYVDTENYNITESEGKFTVTAK